MCRKVFGRQPQHSRHRKIFSEMPLKNVPVPQELLKSSRVFFWRIITSPSFLKEGVTGISILTVTGELRKKLWERNTGEEYLEKIFIQNGKGLQTEKGMCADHAPETDYHKDPTAIFYYGTKLRLVVNLQTNVKAMQSEAYARKVKITNLQQMANTLIYIQEHGYDTRENLTAATSEAHKKLDDAQKRLSDLNAEMKTLNAQIHYTGQYFASKTVYMQIS